MYLPIRAMHFKNINEQSLIEILQSQGWEYANVKKQIQNPIYPHLHSSGGYLVVKVMNGEMRVNLEKTITA